MFRAIFSLAVMVTLFLVPAKSSADHLTIHMPAYSNGTHEYYHELLATALEQAGYIVDIEKVENIPHLRELSMLENGEINVVWRIRSSARDNLYSPIPVNLTNGLIGQRILLVAQRDVDEYKDVRTRGDFRRLGKVGGFGKGWFDVNIWEANFLPYLEVTDWRLLYDMVAEGSRGVDYFSRGFSEVVREVKNYPELVIEPHLMLVYNRDYIFYVSPKTPLLKPILKTALIKARESGLMDRLIKKHWARNYDRIKPENRTIIHLRTPE